MIQCGSKRTTGMSQLHKKSDPDGPLLENRTCLRKGRLEAFLRQASAWGRALAGLELRVGFADHVDRALALHDLAVGVTALGRREGRKNFHGGKRVGGGSA